MIKIEEHLHPDTVQALPLLRELEKQVHDMKFLAEPRFIEPADLRDGSMLEVQSRYVIFGQFDEYTLLGIDLQNNDAIVGIRTSDCSVSYYNSSMERFIACRYKKMELMNGWFEARGRRDNTPEEDIEDAAALREAFEGIDPGCVDGGGFWSVIVEQRAGGLI